jgi:photosynthetic reaction center cytochrome c subunit
MNYPEHQRRLWTVIALGAAAALFLAAKPAPRPQPPRDAAQMPAAKPAAKSQVKTAGEMLPGLTVLKDIPASEFMPTMRYFTVALGVKCEFCHVPGNFASDAKPHKLRAMQMIRMVEAIDRDNFHGFPAVSCYTCHRGSNHPEGMPPLPGVAAAPGLHPPQGQTALQIYQRYIAAIGGQAAIARVQSLDAAGTFTGMNGQAVPVQVSWKAPAPQSEAFAHFTSSGGGLPHWWMQDLTGRLKAQHAAFIPALDLTQRFAHLRVRGGAKIDGRPAYRVMAFGKGGFEQLYFDVQTGLLRRVVTYQRLPVAMLGQATDYGDYVAANGVKTPRLIRITDPSDSTTFRFTRVTVGE